MATMKSSIYSILLCLLCFVATTSAFSPQPVGFSARRTILALSDEPPASSQPKEESKPPIACPDCDLCDGSGRIAGGIGAIFSWIPIKAFRPCPNLIDGGGTYQRSGQGLDEIAFGRDDTFQK